MGTCTSNLKDCCGHEPRTGEYELPDLRDANGEDTCALSLTAKSANNLALVKHIRSTVRRNSGGILARDTKSQARKLESAVHSAPVLKLKAWTDSLKLLR